MEIFGVLFELLLLIFYIGGWAISIYLIWFGRRKKSHTRIALGTLGMGVLVLVTLFLFACVGYGYYWSHSPSCVYEDTFAEKPLSNVHFISAIRESPGDSEHIVLRFKTDHSTFLHLLQKRYGNLPQVPFKELQQDHRGLMSALFLKPESEIYFLEEGHQTTVFGYTPDSETAVLNVDNN